MRSPFKCSMFTISMHARPYSHCSYLPLLIHFKLFFAFDKSKIIYYLHIKSLLTFSRIFQHLTIANQQIVVVIGLNLNFQFTWT